LEDVAIERVEAMTQPQQQLQDADMLQAALESSCDVLMTLQSIEHSVHAGENSTPHVHLARAIDGLRRTISELRLAREEEASIVGLGFVVRSDLESQSDHAGAGDHDHVRPRRTA
jgi:hypothetical protein